MTSNARIGHYLIKSMWQKSVSVVLLLMVGAALSVGFSDRLKKTPQRSTPGCPSLRIEAPNAQQMSQDTWTFTAVVDGFDSKAELRYIWTVDQGKINSGQGTAAITIDRPDLQFKPRLSHREFVEKAIATSSKPRCFGLFTVLIV